MFSELSNIALLLPELVLFSGSLVLLTLGSFSSFFASTRILFYSIGVLLVSFLSIFFLFSDSGVLFDGAFIFDRFTGMMKLLVLLCSMVILWMSDDISFSSGGGSAVVSGRYFEYPILIILSTLGMFVMISSGSLLSLYLGLELQSLCLYVLASMDRGSVRSSEAGLKYFVLGSLGSGMLLYGMSLLYGFTGSVLYSEIAASFSLGFYNLGVLAGISFLLCGFAFKISAVPFHMWTPDVYEGSPTIVTTFFATASKLAIIAVMIRFTGDVFSSGFPHVQSVLILLSAGSMILGAVAAIGQNNIKRLMAYSSIGHMGYALIGIASGTSFGLESVVIYMVIYAVSTLGVFGCILSMRRRGLYFEDIESLSGLAHYDRVSAVILGLLLISLAGIPPLAGFLGKFYIFWSGIDAGLYILSVIGVLSSVVGAYYYLRIVKLMFFDDVVERFDLVPFRLRMVSVASGFFVLFLIFVPGFVLSFARYAVSVFV